MMLLWSRTEGTGELLSSHVVHEGAACKRTDIAKLLGSWAIRVYIVRDRQDEQDPGLKDPESIYVNWCDSIQWMQHIWKLQRRSFFELSHIFGGEFRMHSHTVWCDFVSRGTKQSHSASSPGRPSKWCRNTRWNTPLSTLDIPWPGQICWLLAYLGVSNRSHESYIMHHNALGLGV